MDKEAIATSVAYQELEEQHFKGGYFSEALRAQAETFKTLSEEDKRAFFADTFNTSFDTARQIQEHCGGDTVDLSEQGLGVITVSTEDYSEDDVDQDVPTYRGVLATSDAFNPTPERASVWINSPGDPLGLETTGPTMVQTDHEPENWGESIYANSDGSFHDASDFFGKLDIDTEVMRLLDTKETLDIACEALGIKGQ